MTYDVSSPILSHQSHCLPPDLARHLSTSQLCLQNSLLVLPGISSPQSWLTARDHLATDTCILKRDARNTVAKPLIAPKIRGTVRLAGVEANTPTSLPLRLDCHRPSRHHRRRRSPAASSSYSSSSWESDSSSTSSSSLSSDSSSRSRSRSSSHHRHCHTCHHHTRHHYTHRHHDQRVDLPVPVSLGMTSGVVSLWCYHSCCGTI